MPKLQECVSGACRRLRCLFCAHDYHIVCAIHPGGPGGDSCIDFRPNPELEGKHFRDFLGLNISENPQHVKMASFQPASQLKNQPGFTVESGFEIVSVKNWEKNM